MESKNGLFHGYEVVKVSQKETIRFSANSIFTTYEAAVDFINNRDFRDYMSKITISIREIWTSENIIKGAF